MIQQSEVKYDADIINEIAKRLNIVKIGMKETCFFNLLDRLNLRTLKDYTPQLPGEIGIAVKKSDVTLLNALNEKITEMKADGTLYAILVENGLDKSNMIEKK